MAEEIKCIDADIYKNDDGTLDCIWLAPYWGDLTPEERKHSSPLGVRRGCEYCYMMLEWKTRMKEEEWIKGEMIGHAGHRDWPGELACVNEMFDKSGNLLGYEIHWKLYKTLHEARFHGWEFEFSHYYDGKKVYEGEAPVRMGCTQYDCPANSQHGPCGSKNGFAVCLKDAVLPQAYDSYASHCGFIRVDDNWTLWKCGVAYKDFECRNCQHFKSINTYGQCSEFNDERYQGCKACEKFIKRGSEKVPKQTYYTKCGRTFEKNSTASVTGYELKEEVAYMDTPPYAGRITDDKCRACPFVVDVTEGWGENKKHNRFECRAGSKKPNHKTEWIGSLEDKNTLNIHSLDHNLMEAIRQFCINHPDLGAGYNADHMADCRRTLSISCSQNKKGMAAKKTLIDRFFEEKQKEKTESCNKCFECTDYTPEDEEAQFGKCTTRKITVTREQKACDKFNAKCECDKGDCPFHAADESTCLYEPCRPYGEEDETDYKQDIVKAVEKYKCKSQPVLSTYNDISRENKRCPFYNSHKETEAFIQCRDTVNVHHKDYIKPGDNGKLHNLYYKNICCGSYWACALYGEQKGERKATCCTCPNSDFIPEARGERVICKITGAEVEGHNPDTVCQWHNKLCPAQEDKRKKIKEKKTKENVHPDWPSQDCTDCEFCVDSQCSQGVFKNTSIIKIEKGTKACPRFKVKKAAKNTGPSMKSKGHCDTCGHNTACIINDGKKVDPDSTRLCGMHMPQELFDESNKEKICGECIYLGAAHWFNNLGGREPEKHSFGCAYGKEEVKENPYAAIYFVRKSNKACKYFNQGNCACSQDDCGSEGADKEVTEVYFDGTKCDKECGNSHDGMCSVEGVKGFALEHIATDPEGPDCEIMKGLRVRYLKESRKCSHAHKGCNAVLRSCSMKGEYCCYSCPEPCNSRCGFAKELVPFGKLNPEDKSIQAAATSLPAIFTLDVETVDQVSALNSHLQHIRNKCQDIVGNYIEIGFVLINIKNDKLFRARGYDNLIDCIEAELNMKKSTAYNLIKIAEKFGDSETKRLKAGFGQYNYVQCLEMSTMTKDELDQVNPDMSKRDMQQLKNSNRLESPKDEARDEVKELQPVQLDEEPEGSCENHSVIDVSEYSIVEEVERKDPEPQELIPEQPAADPETEVAEAQDQQQLVQASCQDDYLNEILLENDSLKQRVQDLERDREAFRELISQIDSNLEKLSKKKIRNSLFDFYSTGEIVFNEE